MFKKSLILLCVALAVCLLLTEPGRTSPPQVNDSESVYLPITIRESASQPAVTHTPTPTQTTTVDPDSTATSTPTTTPTVDPNSTPTPTPTPTPTVDPNSTATSTRTPTPTVDPNSTATSTSTPTNTPSSQSGIVVDHTDTDISVIPDYWIEQAKSFAVHYAILSHGRQVWQGLEWLESQDSRFNVDVEPSGSVVLPGDATALRIYVGNNYPGVTGIASEMYWETEDGKTHTRSVADTGWFDFSAWVWCDEGSTYNANQIQVYLDAMAGFETEYPGMRYIYFTAHSDGTAPGGTLWQNNNQIRQYAQDNGKVLFDFNDIEVYAPDGSGPYNNDFEGNCEWCAAWCSAHPTAFECQSMPVCQHNTTGLFCTLKAQAFWVLMARLAGWDGTP